MLSEQDRRDLRTAAASSKLREEFQRLSASSSLPRGAAVDLDQLLNFLNTMNRLFHRSAARPSPVPSPRFRL